MRQLAAERELDGVVLVWYDPFGTDLDPDGNVPTNAIKVHLYERKTDRIHSAEGIYRDAQTLAQGLLTKTVR